MAAVLRNVKSKRLYPFVLARMIGGYGEAGSGAGRGGGSGGSIRDAGGAFGKMEAAHEEQYFRKLQSELLSKVKREHQKQCLYHDEEIKFHEDAIKRHTESIERHRLLKSQHEATVRQQDSVEKQQLYDEQNKKK
ncbi:ATPase inhibitor mai-1, mitochondrial-like [Hydractinia symbiolongicarpus]|uniref:ATPase inhibitor mai-1, mitochondrial-like n=1 Tax=Hydractinia symbiolongicarpus TaxID=13093 RepID=UPI00254B5031|nr:ATPase inhibitor mai-1, mitochondrial-like [Hydractinia symbiolongicarpus]XP_057310328.1 ATPase inhibitor mai-1, mitochondrial-like [Hydractinia symbiolongicarpus]